MTVRVICFDFDGTIGDSRDTFVAIANCLAKEFGYTPITEERLSELGNLNLMKLIRQSEIAFYKIPFLIWRLKQELSQEMKNINPIVDIPEVLGELKEQGYLLKIVTSNSEANVSTFLAHQNLHSLFDSLNAGISLQGKHHIIRRIIKDNNYQPTSVIYVGDEVRDVKAARKIPGVIAIAVTWGFSSKAILDEAKPDYLITHPQDLLNVIKDLSRVKA